MHPKGGGKEPFKQRMTETKNTPLNQEEDFEALLQESFEAKSSLQEGNIVTGKVVHISKDHVVVDVGYKSEGNLDRSQFSTGSDEADVQVGDEVDVFLETLENDPLTRTVLLYIESVKDGRRFFESARRMGSKKPIVLMKGGQSKAGTKAASSHTGALSTDSRIFNAVCRQAGIVKVEHPMDLLDLSAAFSSLPLPRGRRAAPHHLQPIGRHPGRHQQRRAHRPARRLQAYRDHRQSPGNCRF